MSTQVQHRRGTTAQNNALTGAPGEITVDTTKKTAVVHDGTTAGGTPLAKESALAAAAANVALTGYSIAGTAALPASTDTINGAIGKLAKTASDSTSQLTDIAQNVKSYGAKSDGITDDSDAVIAAISAVSAAGGGVVFFPEGTYRIDSQIVIPVVDGEIKPITLRGVGSHKNGVESTAAVSGGTTLNLRYTGSGGKINSLGCGTLTIEELHLTQNVSASDSSVFLFSTHSTPHIHNVSVCGHSSLSGITCIQDAFQFGNIGGTWDEPPWFQGYGGFVKDCTFDRIRSGIIGRKAFNSFFCANLTWTNLCGSNNTQGAIDIEGTGDQSVGNVFIGMCIEVCGYPYPIRLAGTSENVFVAPAFWDATSVLTHCFKLETVNGVGCIKTQVVAPVFTSIPTTKWVTGGELTGVTRLGIGFAPAIPEDILHLCGAKTGTNTKFGDKLGILLQNTDPTVGNFTSLNNRNANDAVNAGIFFKNVDHGTAGQIDFGTRDESGKTHVPVSIDKNANVRVMPDSALTNTNFAGPAGIQMQNQNSGVGNFTSLTNQNWVNWQETSGIFFINVDQEYKGAVAIATRSASGEYGTRFYINELGQLVAGTSTTPGAGALMTLNSTSKGLLPPRMTTAQRDAITTPSEGLMVYNITTHTLDFYNGSAWKQIAGA